MREVQAITRLADDKGYTVVGALPFDPAVTGAMIRRKALTETGFAARVHALRHLGPYPRTGLRTSKCARCPPCGSGVCHTIL